MCSVQKISHRNYCTLTKIVHHLVCPCETSVVNHQAAELLHSVTFRALLVGQIKKADARKRTDKKYYIKPPVVEVEL